MSAIGPPRLVPPRPIPDPLPWPEPASWANGPVLVAIALVLLIGLAAGHWLRRRRQPTPSPSIAPLESPPDGLVERAERIRSALVERFGASWSARTTEEIAGSQPLIDRLGPERAGQLIEYLRLADRAKFAPLGEPPAPVPTRFDDPWLTETLARLAA